MKPLLALAAFLLLLLPTPAPAGGPPGVIRSLPYEIKSSGRYILEDSLTAAPGTEGIRISAPDVVLDLCGFTLATTSVSGNGAAGIHLAPVKNVVVKNGTIRGFATGLIILGSNTNEMNSAHVVENLRILDARTEGIYVEAGCGGTAIRRCEVMGIGPAATGTAIAIDFRCAYGVVSENRIQCTDTGLSILGPHCLVSSNAITAGSVGISFGTGSSGTRMNNLVLGATRPYEGGLDGGGNQ